MCAVLLTSLASGACGVTMTFDENMPIGYGLGYYYTPNGGTGWGISWDSGFYIADHSGSSWGAPHSGSKVLAWSYPGFWTNAYGFMLKKAWLNPSQTGYAYSVGGYFSTEPGVVLQLIGYCHSLDKPVASATIGSVQGAWENVHVQIDSPSGQITMVELKPVTTDALAHFCADDINVDFVPEPSSLLALAAGLAALGTAARRRRR